MTTLLYAPPPVTDDTTRRRFLAALGAAGLLTACGNQQPDPVDQPVTRQVDHARGSTAIPTDPRRIVAVDYYGVLAALVEVGLGDRVVGIYPLSPETGSGVPELLAGAVGEVQDVVDGDGALPNLERVATLRPDLIIGGDPYVGEVYTELSAIAPTVALGVDQFDYFATLDAVATALDRPEQVMARLDELETRIRELRIESESVTVTQLASAERLRAYGGGWLVDTLTRAGATIVPAGLGGLDENGRTELSPERLGILTGDTILNVEGTAEQAELRAGFAEVNPLWAGLPAVRSGRVFPLGFEEFSGIAGITGYLALLDRINEILRPSEPVP